MQQQLQRQERVRLQRELQEAEQRGDHSRVMELLRGKQLDKNMKI